MTEQEYLKLRKSLTISQACAIVSLFIGGVILSGVAVGFAFSVYRRAKAADSGHAVNSEQHATLVKSAKWAAGMALLALALNAISLALWYPVLAQIAQTGDFSTLFGQGAPSAPSSGGSSSVWG